jgi:hypothetical protein
MNHYLLHHRHPPGDCAAVFAAWNGFESDLRNTDAMSSCVYGGHEIWWWVDAADQPAARSLLPRFVAEMTVIVRVAPITVI